MEKISPFLWFNNQAEEAAKFYVSLFKNSKINHISRYPEGSPWPAGTAMVVDFELDGREFLALNGGPQFQFTEAISMMVRCESQEEIDHFWSSLSSGGKEVQCGWLKDRYGLSWQVVPAALNKLMSNPATAPKVMAELMKMTKLEIATLERAAKS